MNDLLIYSLPTNGLGAAINVAKEIHSEMGMKPDEIPLLHQCEPGIAYPVDADHFTTGEHDKRDEGW